MNEELLQFNTAIAVIENTPKFIEHIKQYTDLDAIKGQVLIELRKRMPSLIRQFIFENKQGADQYRIFVNRLAQYCFVRNQESTENTQQELAEMKEQLKEEKFKLIEMIKQAFPKKTVHPDAKKLSDKITAIKIDFNLLEELREFKDPEAMRGIVIKELAPSITPFVSNLLRTKSDISQKYNQTLVALTSVLYIKSRAPDSTTNQRLDSSEQKLYGLVDDLVKLISSSSGGRRRTRRRKTRKHRR